jgi:predicted aldo/keto reductase-like oxidoreductase
MKYRRFGKLDWKVSALGFGAMRLPTIGGDRGNVDEKLAIAMIRYAIDHGVNYIDTAYRYHEGNSEIVVGKALRDGYREKVRLATKMPMRQVSAREELDKIFNEQLEKLQVKYVDNYLLHGLDEENWTKVKELNVIDWAEKKINEGKIHYLGFSFHDSFNVFKGIIDSYNGWAFCQIQYNYVDTKSCDRTPGTKGLKYASDRGLAVVIMEPIQGGNLAVKPPEEIANLFLKEGAKRSPADWALQWVWNQPEVSLALSGMSTMNQVVENVDSASNSGPGTMLESNLKFLSKIRKTFLSYGFIGCTGCRYCQPCAQGVAIPEILASYNDYYKNQNDAQMEMEIKKKFEELINAGTGPDKCISCGECEEKCPQQLPIRNLVSRANMTLGPPR